MKLFAIAVIVLTSFAGNCVGSIPQAKVSDEEISARVNQLSWDSIGGECNLVWRIFPDGPAARRLIQIGKPATRELLKVLSDEEKGVAAHLILTAIWEPDNVAYENWFEGNEIEGGKFIHVYNGLKWMDVIDFKKPSVRYKVDSGDLIKNSEAWHRKLGQYRAV